MFFLIYINYWIFLAHYFYISFGKSLASATVHHWSHNKNTKKHMSILVDDDHAWFWDRRRQRSSWNHNQTNINNLSLKVPQVHFLDQLDHCFWCYFEEYNTIFFLKEKQYKVSSEVLVHGGGIQKIEINKYILMIKEFP